MSTARAGWSRPVALVVATAPVGRLIVLRTTGKAELLRAIAYLTWPALAAPVVAPLAGGLITQALGWPWIFYLNVPLGVEVFFVALRVMPTDAARAPRRLDLRGLAGASTTLVALVLAGAHRRATVSPHSG